MNNQEVLHELMNVGEDEKFSADELYKCITREIAMRYRVYPRRIVAGSMQIETAIYEIAMMKAIRKLIEKTEREQKDLFA